MARRRTSGNGTALLIAAGIILWNVGIVGKFVEANAVVLACVAAAVVITFIVYRLVRSNRVTRASPGVDRGLEPAMARPVGDQSPRREQVRQAAEPSLATSSRLPGPSPEFVITPLVDAPETRRPASRGRGPADAPRWIAPGEAVVIGGVTITAGLFYFGRPTPTALPTVKCLIDPSLTIAKRGRGSTGEAGYWPSYAHVTPAARRSYVDWLAGGRCDPGANIGIVFLFFYGLERRLLFDRDHGSAAPLIAEVQRLLAVYGGNGSFRGYVQRFLNAAALMAGPTGEPPLRRLASRDSHYEMRIDVRVYLGQLLAANQRFDAATALLWLSAMPETSFRTPVSRCEAEFEALWQIRFDDAHPTGLKVTAPKQTIVATYRAASGDFDAPVDGPHQVLPDIAVLSAPLKGLRQLADRCSDELDAYSRLLGRRPAARGGAEAVFALPPELQGVIGIPALISRFASSLGDDGHAVLTGRQLFEIADMPFGKGARVPAHTANALLGLLDRIDIGIEPDPRHAGVAFEADATVVAFEASGGAPVVAGDLAFTSTQACIEAAIVALQLGTANRGAEPTVLQDIRADKTIAPPAKSRLLALGALLTHRPLKPAALLRKLQAVPPFDREGVARAAVQTILTTGQVDQTAVRFLESLFRVLELPVEAVYPAIHRAGPLPDSPEPPSHRGMATINDVRLRRLQEETRKVSDLLAGIFVEETPGMATPTVTVTQAAAGFDGLDAAHSNLLARLLEIAPLPINAFDREARAHRLLGAGAIETINDWAFDRFDQPLLEVDDAVAIAQTIRDCLTAPHDEDLTP